VRPSNTEPLLRLNLEASTAALRDEKRAEVVAVLGAQARPEGAHA
jgi:phosphomannomutase